MSGTRNFGTIAEAGAVALLGVVVFFVISGFLITTLLDQEYRKRGRISLKLFYARRSLRIFPAAYAFLAVAAALWLLGYIQLTPRDLVHAATYTANYYPERAWQIGHLWSLSVEEQFYLLWPFAVVALGPRSSTWLAVAVVLLGPVARAGAWWVWRGNSFEYAAAFPMIADTLAVGCVLARLRSWLEQQRWYLFLFHPAISILVAALVLLLNHYRGYTIVNVAGSSVINLLLAFLIHRAVYRPADAFGRFLNWKPFASIGLLSYSLYLWQQLFLNRASTAWINSFPQNILLAIVTALASYWLLEKPLLSLRHRLRA